MVFLKAKKLLTQAQERHKKKLRKLIQNRLKGMRQQKILPELEIFSK